MKQAELSYNRKRQLADSLKMLMVKKNLKKITVQEIADGCGANRYTFYYHFKDIYDLLMWMFQEEALSLIKTSENCLTWPGDKTPDDSLFSRRQREPSGI